MSTQTELAAVPRHMRHLAIANETRFAISAVKREIAASRLTIAEALDDPRAQRLTIFDLFKAQRRWGPRTTRRALEDIGCRLGCPPLPELKRVRDLTDRQRRAIAEFHGRTG